MAERVAVLLCGYGEVDEYDEFAEYNERSFKLLVSKSIKFPDFSIPWLSRRLERSQKKEWHAANHYHSPHNAIFERQREGIERALQERYGNDVAVFKAFNFVPPFLPEQVLKEIRAQGFEKIVVYPWLVVDSVFTAGLALEQINEALAPDPSWVRGMRYLPSFWERDEFQKRLVDQIEEGIAPLLERYAPSQVGVMLCLHGCPLESKGYETGVRESEALYYAMQERLITKYPLMTPGWMNHPVPGKWTTPDVDQAAENLITLGAKAIVFVPIGFVTENHETQLDIGYTIDKVKDKVETVHLPTLNEDPQLMRLGAEWITPLIDELRVG
ncbi:MAG: ferrochelatase [Acidimicrobiia bacterium]|nr:ferrochelatase [Acidimicrobiia bacterium]